MKRLLLILTFLLTGGLALFAQDDDEREGSEKIRDRMSEYIQKQLNATDEESKKFKPVFEKYFKEWRQTVRENRGDKLIRQQKVVDLRLRYRPQFRDILGEKRGYQVFHHQDVFIKEMAELRRSRMKNNPRQQQRLIQSFN